MPKINSYYYYFLFCGFQWGHMIEYWSISRKSATPPNMCSLLYIFKLLILYQYLRGICCFVYSKNKTGQKAKFCFRVHVLSLFRQNHYLSVFFSWAALFLLEIYWWKENALAISTFFFCLKVDEVLRVWNLMCTTVFFVIIWMMYSATHWICAIHETSHRRADKSIWGLS